MKKNFVEVSYLTSVQATHVVLKFDKLKAFKDGKVERKFEMGYYPWGVFANGGYQQRFFLWKLKLIKSADQTVSLQFL